MNLVFLSPSYFKTSVAPSSGLMLVFRGKTSMVLTKNVFDKWKVFNKVFIVHFARFSSLPWNFKKESKKFERFAGQKQRQNVFMMAMFQ